MRLMVTLKALLSEDSDQLQRDLDVSQVVDDTLVTSWDGGIVTLAPSVTNQSISFGGVVNGKYLVMLVWSGEVVYRANSTGSSPISVKPNPATTPDPILPYQKQDQPGLVMIGPISAAFPLTALFLSNPSATVPTRVQVVVVGESV